MGRLIDEDETIGRIYSKIDEKYNKFGVDNSTEYLVSMLCVDEVRASKTAYNLEKVLDQLKEKTAFLKDCSKYGGKTDNQRVKSYDTMMMYEVADLVDDLIEIVKCGGF